jgi:hypothetical protein
MWNILTHFGRTPQISLNVHLLLRADSKSDKEKTKSNFCDFTAKAKKHQMKKASERMYK